MKNLFKTIILGLWSEFGYAGKFVLIATPSIFIVSFYIIIYANMSGAKALTCCYLYFFLILSLAVLVGAIEAFVQELKIK